MHSLRFYQFRNVTDSSVFLCLRPPGGERGNMQSGGDVCTYVCLSVCDSVRDNPRIFGTAEAIDFNFLCI